MPRECSGQKKRQLLNRDCSWSSALVFHVQSPAMFFAFVPCYVIFLHITHASPPKFEVLNREADVSAISISTLL